MNLQELRINNWYYDSNRNINFQWKLKHYHLLYANQIKLCNIKPIVLNDRWLFKFGFQFVDCYKPKYVKTNPHLTFSRFHISENHYIDHGKETKEYRIESNDSLFTYTDYYDDEGYSQIYLYQISSRNIINYVHELQNQYFNITDSELRTKRFRLKATKLKW